MEKHLNILMGMDSYYPIVDGVCESMHNYLLNLNKRENAFALVPKIDKKQEDNFPYTIYRCKSMYLPFYKNRYPIINFDFKTKKDISEKQIDIIHLHSPFAICKYTIKLAKQKYIPIVATFHTKFREAFLEKIPSKHIANLLAKKIGKTLNKLTEVFVANDNIAKELRTYGYHGKITIMPLGTDLEKSKSNETLIKIANTKFNLKPDELIFLFVGRLEKGKNIEFSLNALSELKKDFSNFKFIIVGKGSYYKKLQDKVNALNLQNNVIFTGFIDRQLLPALYARANLLLFPSPFDTLGLVKIEASAYNTPTLTLSDSCASYGIKDNENGYIVANSIESYLSKLKDIITDINKLKEVGERASNTLYINWQQASDKLLTRYKELIEENKKKYNLRKCGKLNEY